MTIKNKSLVPTEDQESIALFEWAQLHKSLWVREFLFHIENEGKCSPTQGAKAKAKGKRAGVSDYFLPLPNGAYAGLWIELKRKGEKPTASNQKRWARQIDWLKAMNKLGYWAEMCFGWEDAARLIDLYINKGLKKDVD